jgi:hypothetical protein
MSPDIGFHWGKSAKYCRNLCPKRRSFDPYPSREIDYSTSGQQAESTCASTGSGYAVLYTLHPIISLVLRWETDLL